MKAKLLLSMTIAVISFANLSAQSADEDAIKQIAKMESESYAKKDTVAWKALFIQDEKTTRTYSGNGFYNSQIGWQQFGPQLIAFMKSDPKPLKMERIIDSNIIIRISGDMAFLQYDQAWIKGGNDSPVLSREYRTLMKINSDWKIASLYTLSTNSYTDADSSTIENNLNGTGYQLLNAKKIKDAIDVFKLNVKLFPKSWNVYDSLGEAYMNDGNTAEAIKNYEASIKMNPDNESGKQMLAKLKKK